jgi:hypothetical protein
LLGAVASVVTYCSYPVGILLLSAVIRVTVAVVRELTMAAATGRPIGLTRLRAGVAGSLTGGGAQAAYAGASLAAA